MVQHTVQILTGNLYNRKVLIVPVDFTDGQQVYEDIAKQLADLDIGILGMWISSMVTHDTTL